MVGLCNLTSVYTSGIPRFPNTDIVGLRALDYAVLYSWTLLCPLWWLISS